MTSTTRYLCPLDCGWHHDQTAPAPGEPATGCSAMQQAMAVEAAVRAHLETHGLIEWVQALSAARTERDEWKRRAEEDGEQACARRPHCDDCDDLPEPRFAEGNPVPMPVMDAAGQMWLNGKPWPPR